LSDPVAPEDVDPLEDGRLMFARPSLFVMGVARMDQLPPADRPEVAFAGRSNVGKSSLLNALTGRKQLARTSNTPGRTRELNFFDIGEGRLYLVDLPGYGYAEASKTSVQAWTQLTLDYLRGRPTLKRVFVLIDGRHGPKKTDLDTLDKLDEAAVSYQAVLTKADKVKQKDIEATRLATLAALKKRPAAHPVVHVTSSETGAGVPELRAEVAALG
jgi:GTP-binding protein